MRIFQAKQTQLPIVRELAHTIWPVAYGGILSAHQIAYMLELMYSIPSLEQQFANRPFLLVEDQAQFIGFASYEPHFQGRPVTKIHKIYVLPQTQGKGVGRQLIEYIEKLAASHHNTIVELTVNKQNKARGFYEKLGFFVSEEAVFDIGNGYVMDDYIMQKTL